ncbi:MAG: pentapeptide repeat-containing protein [bacterium]|nr:pentapeptide repeat-containing protein [bacterium]
MIKYEKYSKEIIISHFRERKSFIDNQIIENDLSNIEMSGGLFQNVEFDLSILNAAGFAEAECENMVINQSDLKEINFTKSKQALSYFANCNMIKACFDGSRLLKFKMRNCIAHSLSLNNVSIMDSLFDECEMYKIKMSNAVVMKTSFSPGIKKDIAGMNKALITSSLVVDSSFAGMNLSGANFNNSTFINCDFTGAVLDDIQCENSRFINCSV